MSDQDQNKNEHHYEYDGIVEHNNPMPGWWTWGFIFTIIFAFIYYIHYEISGGPTLKDELKQSMTELDKIRAESGADQGTVSEADVMKKISDPQSIEKGKAIFVAKCAVCHGDKLEGKIGPNLTDKFWIHGDGKPAAIATTVSTGVAAKGMPPWKGVIQDEEISEVTSYIVSLKGSNPANGKAPEGTEYP